MRVCTAQDLTPMCRRCARNHYADASSTTGSVTYAVYAPFSIVPLWNSQGRADRAVIGGTAAPGQDALCTDAGQRRCANVYLDLGVFPYARSGAAMASWNGTVLVDKADATGTYYRRNRSYDPATARFTQEDPIGLAGGMNAYGFASGDPVNYADPFGLWPSSLQRVSDLFSRAVRVYERWNEEAKTKQAARDAELDALMKAPLGTSASIRNLTIGAVLGVEGSGEQIVERKALGADGGKSVHVLEKVGGRTNSITHRVELDGDIIHQHQTHIGKYGGERRFPDEWTGTQTIDRPKQ